MSKYNIIQLEERDFDELMDVLSRAFQKANHNYFSEGVGAYYQKTAECMKANYAIKIEGKIAAVVGLFPMKYQMGETLLKCAGIGGVCVAPEFRGQKLMGILMEHVVGVIKIQEYDLAWLSGDRQRYRYYGWEKSGTENHFKLIKSNVKHAKFNKTEGAICQSLNVDNNIDVGLCYKFYERQQIHCKWSVDDFAKRLRHRFSHTYLLKNKTGDVVAYAYLNKDKTQIQEILGDSLNSILTLVDRLIEEFGILDIVLPYEQNPEFVRWLYDNAQTHAIANARSWMICDLPKVINAAATMRELPDIIEDAFVNIRITDEDKVMNLSVHNGCLSARWESDDVAVSLEMAKIDLQQLLFSPSQQHRPLSMLLPVVMHESLPLFLATADHC